MINDNVPYMTSISESAEQTGCSYGYIRKLIDSNVIKYVKSGNKFLVNFNDLVDYLNGEGRFADD